MSNERGVMRLAVGWLILGCGLAFATVTIGTGLGYFIILDSGDVAAPATWKDTAELAVICAFELFLVVLGARLIRGSRKSHIA
jgi:hypothetical protein